MWRDAPKLNLKSPLCWYSSRKACGKAALYIKGFKSSLFMKYPNFFCVAFCIFNPPEWYIPLLVTVIRHTRIGSAGSISSGGWKPANQFRTGGSYKALSQAIYIHDVVRNAEAKVYYLFDSGRPWLHQHLRFHSAGDLLPPTVQGIYRVSSACFQVKCICKPFSNIIISVFTTQGFILSIVWLSVLHLGSY